MLKPVTPVEAIELELPCFPITSGILLGICSPQPSQLHAEPDERKRPSSRSLARHQPETTKPIWLPKGILIMICRAVGDYQLSIFFMAKLGDPGDVCVDKSLVTRNPDCSWSDLLCRWKRRCSWWLSTMCRCCKWSLYTVYILNMTIPVILYVK